MDTSTSFKTPLSPEAQLLEDLNRRQTILAYIFAFGFAVYGLTSFKVIHLFNAHLTLWGNIYPRLLLNSLPYLALALITQRRLLSPQAAAKLGMVSFPFVFMLACMIEVWPLIAKGHSELYGFVHGANVFIIVMTILFLCPSTALLRLLLASFTVFFVLPVIGILFQSGHMALLEMFLGDMLLMLPIAYFLAKKIHHVQRRLAFAEHDLKQRIKPFLGDYVASALYENRDDLLRDRESQGIILSLDIRGFSKLMKELSPQELHDFLRNYYSAVGKIVHEHGGQVHKSMGDGHLISFGVMDLPDLNDIPDLAPAVALAEQRRKSELYQHALKSFFAIENEFQKLLAPFPKLPKGGLGLGGGMAHGLIQLAIYGDENHKKEYEISGEAVVLSARLEQYTKVLRAEHKEWQNGIFSVLISADPTATLLQENQREWFQTKTLKTPIPDFAHIRNVWFTSLVTNGEEIKKLAHVS